MVTRIISNWITSINRLNQVWSCNVCYHANRGNTSYCQNCTLRNLENRLHLQHGSALGHVYLSIAVVDSTTALSPVHSTPQWSHRHVYCMYGVARLQRLQHVGTKWQMQISTTSQAMNAVQLACIIHIQPHPCATPTHQPLLWRLDPTCAKSCYLSPLFPAKCHLHSFSSALAGVHVN